MTETAQLSGAKRCRWIAKLKSARAFMHSLPARPYCGAISVSPPSKSFWKITEPRALGAEPARNQGAPPKCVGRRPDGRTAERGAPLGFAGIAMKHAEMTIVCCSTTGNTPRLQYFARGSHFDVYDA